MRRILLVVTLAVFVSIADRSGFGGDTAVPSSDTGDTLESEDPSVNATATNQSVRIEATESVVGSE
ncbi:hypothetical protein [Natrinema ejinorense]|uniref:hypothetical protein n=1 Tax=Natrinema ejinorense TaxID=373386 RepID=UPI001FEA1120|nr:hypothetical protein [Natrinema ejinorense]